jgi:hypothetical protein
MRRHLYVLAIILFTFIHALPANAVNVFKHYDKVIWIDQPRQTGTAYEKGQKLFSFPLMTGDDETPTPPGAYVVRVKDADYYSHHYKQPMPYSIFFDFRAKRAIHEGEVPDPKEMSKWATHGCIHVEEPYIKRLFDWTEEKKTLVVVRGKRDWALEDQIGEVDEGIQDNQEDQENQEKQDNQEIQENQQNQKDREDQDRQKGQESEDEELSGSESVPDQPSE